MSEKLTRRKALTAGAATTGIAFGFPATNAQSKRAEEEIPYAKRSWWRPGGNKDYKKNLKPGTNPIRLACMAPETMLNYPETDTITEMVKKIRDRGYTAANGHYGMGKRNKWLDASDSEIKELKDALKQYDVDFYDIMVWTNLIHPDEKKRQTNLKYVCEAFQAADRTGVRSITGITGSMAPGVYSMHILMHPDNWTKEAWNRSVQSIRQILRDTSGCKTVWGMEQCITTNVNSPLATKHILEDVGDPRCKCVLDVTNMISLDTYYHSAELIDEVFDLLGEDIVGCHAKDFKLNERMLVDLVEVPPGKGIQDYETYLARLSRMEWPRTLMLEHFPVKEYPAAKAFIEKTARDTGVTIYS